MSQVTEQISNKGWGVLPRTVQDPTRGVTRENQTEKGAGRTAAPGNVVSGEGDYELARQRSGNNVPDQGEKDGGHGWCLAEASGTRRGDGRGQSTPRSLNSAPGAVRSSVGWTGEE